MEVMGMPDREKVIEGLKICKHRVISQENCMECPYIYDGRAKQTNCEGVLHLDALELLKEQEERWIPVTERLPRSIANKVLVYVQHEDYVGYIGYGHYEKYKGQEMWFDLEHNEEFSKRGYTVTHWMETPMPPMEGR